MIRGLAFFSLAAVLLAVISFPLMLLQPGLTVLGGHYSIGPEEILKEDVSFYFAQVTIDEGAVVDGHISLYSSTLDLNGNVTKDIHAFESDLTLHEDARVGGVINEKDFIHWTVLLPVAFRVP